MPIIKRTSDGYFWTPSWGSLTSGTGYSTRDRSKYPHMWTSDKSTATSFTDEEADVRIKYLKRYYDIDAVKV